METKTKIRNMLNYKHTENTYFKSTQPSCTVPDQTMSLKTLLERNSRGLPIEGNHHEPMYYGNETPINPKTLDLTEIHELAMENQQLINNLQDELRESEKTKNKNKIKKQLLQEIEDEKNITP